MKQHSKQLHPSLSESRLNCADSNPYSSLLLLVQQSSVIQGLFKYFPCASFVQYCLVICLASRAYLHLLISNSPSRKRELTRSNGVNPPILVLLARVQKRFALTTIFPGHRDD
ncbi:hypothetical protein E2C01_077222 [Portunus trituberculatus]|uniref:Uncharacterized protein n=1 Tax=Portunus trituberculatus TaxID=210409 RepID=A0A5B7IKU5_PORTR|nr:hypothetical protein [Portunus trituberculatus]